MTDPAYPPRSGSGSSRGLPDLTTHGIGTPEVPVSGWPSCSSCCGARMGRSRCRTTLPVQVSPQWCISPPDSCRDPRPTSQDLDSKEPTGNVAASARLEPAPAIGRSEEHTSELPSRHYIV